MDMEPRHVTSIVAMCCIVVIAGFAGCTANVMRNNTNYYQMVERCIAAGGTFIPVAGGNSNAACIRAPSP